MTPSASSESATSLGSAIGRMIQETREKRGLSAEKVARRADISVDTIRSIEQGRVPNPRIGTVVTIASALGVGVDKLVGPADPTYE